MTNTDFAQRFADCFETPPALAGNFANLQLDSGQENQDQPNAVFSEKWTKFDGSDDEEKLYSFRRDWYLTLYGFSSEAALRDFLTVKQIIFDARCGLGYKAAWFAELAPNALVIGMDFSEAASHPAARYADGSWRWPLDLRLWGVSSNVFWRTGFLPDPRTWWNLPQPIFARPSPLLEGEHIAVLNSHYSPAIPLTRAVLGFRSI